MKTAKFAALMLALVCLGSHAAAQSSCPESENGIQGHTWVQADTDNLPLFSDGLRYIFGNPGTGRVCTECGKAQAFFYSDTWVYALREDGTAEIVRCDQPETVGSLTVPETLDGIPVTAIGDKAFSQCYYLTDVTLPEGITHIGDFAFEDCTDIETLTIPGTVTSMGCNPFIGTTIHLQLAGSNTALEQQGAFLLDRETKRLICCQSSPEGSEEDPATLVIPTGTREIGDYAFSRSDAVQVVLPAGVTKIGQCAFQRCLSLQSVTLPAGLTDIGDHAFQRCSKLEEVNLPDSVTRLGRNPFAGSPVTLSLSASHPALELRADVLIERSTGKLLSFPCVGSEPAYEIPGDIREIGEFAFAYCKDLFTLTVPANVEIAENAFYRNEAIEEVTLPEGLTVIRENTFWGCINLKTVEIPGSVTEIGAFAFNCCQAMETLTFPKSLVRLGEGAFQGCLALREVTVPSAIGIIPARAFDACIRLERVEIQEGITQIAPYAFYDCEMLQAVTLPESLTRIDRYAFYRCAILENITIPAAVNRLGDEVFGMCPKLTVTAAKGSEAAAYCAGNDVPFAEK